MFQIFFDVVHFGHGKFGFDRNRNLSALQNVDKFPARKLGQFRGSRQAASVREIKRNGLIDRGFFRQLLADLTA